MSSDLSCKNLIGINRPASRPLLKRHVSFESLRPLMSLQSLEDLFFDLFSYIFSVEQPIFLSTVCMYNGHVPEGELCIMDMYLKVNYVLRTCT